MGKEGHLSLRILKKAKNFGIKKYEIKTFKLENRSVEKVNLMERNDESL